MSKNLRVVGAATATLVIISLIFASPLGVSAQSHVVRYKNCKRFQEAYRETLFAKDDRSRTKYIRYQIDNFYEPEKTVVDRKFYARNRHLDRDRDHHGHLRDHPDFLAPLRLEPAWPPEVR